MGAQGGFEEEEGRPDAAVAGISRLYQCPAGLPESSINRSLLPYSVAPGGRVASLTGSSSLLVGVGAGFQIIEIPQQQQQRQQQGGRGGAGAWANDSGDGGSSWGNLRAVASGSTLLWRDPTALALSLLVFGRGLDVVLQWSEVPVAAAALGAAPTGHAPTAYAVLPSDESALGAQEAIPGCAFTAVVTAVFVGYRIAGGGGGRGGGASAEDGGSSYGLEPVPGVARPLALTGTVISAADLSRANALRLALSLGLAQVRLLARGTRLACDWGPHTAPSCILPSRCRRWL